MVQCMIFSALYEPETVPISDGFSTRFRSVTIDMDGYRDATAAGARVLEQMPDCDRAQISYMLMERVPGQDTRVVPEGELDKLSASDRNRLMASVMAKDKSGGALASITLWTARGLLPRAEASSGDTEWTRRATGAMARSLLDNGHPRINIYRVRRALVYVPLLLLIASTMWWQLSNKPSLSASAMAWLLNIFAIAGTIALDRVLAKQESTKSRGCFILSENRAEVEARRGDHRRDTRVALITGAITLIVTVLAAVVIYTVGIRN